MDKFVYKFCDLIDGFNTWLNNLFAPRCKCKRNKPKPLSDKEWIKGYKKWKKK
jgi:hypothetical protein